jgi:hypothetical protein
MTGRDGGYELVLDAPGTYHLHVGHPTVLPLVEPVAVEVTAMDGHVETRDLALR